MIRRNKKSQIDVQFNWIFVLIAGGIILLFFVGMVIKQKGVSEQKLSATLVTNLDAIFTAAKVASGTASPIELPGTQVDFRCDGFSIGGVTKSLEGNIIFAPDSLKGDEMITWSQPFNFPFKVSDFLYLTSDKIRYIFVCESVCDKAQEIYDALPDELEKYMCNIDEGCVPNEIKDKNNFKVKMMFFGNSMGRKIPSKLQDADVSAIKFSLPMDSIEFYEKSGKYFSAVNGGKNFTSPTGTQLVPSMLYAAIYSESKELYDCMMARAMQRLSVMSEINKNRAETLLAKEVKYRFSASGNFGNLKSYADVCAVNFGSESSNECDANKMREMRGFSFGETQVNSIEGNNIRLQKLGCPLIY